MKNNLLEYLMNNVENAEAEETEEILKEMESLSEDDLQISTVRKFGFEGDELCCAHEE